MCLRGSSGLIMLMCFYKLLNCRHIFFLNYKLFVITIIPIMIPVQTLNFISRNILPFFLRKCSSIAGYCIARIFKVPFGRCGDIGHQQKIVVCLSAFLLRLSMEACDFCPAFVLYFYFLLRFPVHSVVMIQSPPG